MKLNVFGKTALLITCKCISLHAFIIFITSIVAGSCDFEYDLCGWSNLDDDEFDWVQWKDDENQDRGNI